MAEQKHTPGPWTFEKFRFGSPDAPISHMKIVGPPYGPHGAKNLIAEVHMQHTTCEADGQLLAAAPELLEALDDALTALLHSEESADDWHAAIVKGEAAIAKAKGD